MNEPQSVTDLMAETRARWARECDACEDEACDARRELYHRLCALADEYPLADYPRREDIEKALRGLMDRHRALPPIDLPDDEVDVPDDDVALGAEAAAALGEPEPVPPPRPQLYAELEKVVAAAAPAPRGKGPEPGGEPAPEAPAEKAPGKVSERAPEQKAAGTEGPPHGAGRAPAGEGRPSPRFEAGEGHGDFGPEPSRGATGGIGERVGGWFRWAYHELDYQALARKREWRLAELGGRVQELAAAGHLADVASDEAVRHMLAQVEQVDAAMAEHRARCAE